MVDPSLRFIPFSVHVLLLSISELSTYYPTFIIRNNRRYNREVAIMTEMKARMKFASYIVYKINSSSSKLISTCFYRFVVLIYRKSICKEWFTI